MSKINLKCIFDSIAQEEGLGLVNKCMEWNLIKREIPCEKCNKPGSVMTLRRSRDLSDSFKWYCNNMRSRRKQKRRRCDTAKSLRSGTVFYGSRLSIWQVLCFFVMWVKNVPMKVIESETEMGSTTSLDLSTFCSKIVKDWLAKHNQKIGGTENVIQVAHKYFGQKNEGLWVVFGMDASSGNFFTDVLEELNDQTIPLLMEKYVVIGSKIVSGSDEYNILNNHGYHHIKIDRKMNFVDPETGLHRNNVLGLVNALNSSIPTKGRKKETVINFAHKFAFLKCCKLRKLDSFIELCNEIGIQFGTVNNEEELDMEVTNNVTNIGVESDQPQNGQSDEPNTKNANIEEESDMEVTNNVTTICVESDQPQNGQSDELNAKNL